jgi:hypothetical protein
MKMAEGFISTPIAFRPVRIDSVTDMPEPQNGSTNRAYLDFSIHIHSNE